MAKPKGGGKGGSGGASAPPKCTCDHPFECSCGNRPPRPSRGHKWDPATQQWGGKGHRQKGGGSGQVATVAQQAATTAVGKTVLAQWQRLPSQLLQEYCQKQKRPLPKYAPLTEKQPNLFKVRVIIPDPKESTKDLFFVPAQAVANEEQAREEAALLALLSMTPNLPHERKLPEPYKTTWLNSIQVTSKPAPALPKSKHVGTAPPSTNLSAQNMPEESLDAMEKQSDTATTVSSTSSVSAAQASTRLVAAQSYTSQAQRQQQAEQQRQERNARTRKHEAVRFANQLPSVFMSASIRRALERLLRGASAEDTVEDDDLGHDDPTVGQEEGEENVLQGYIIQRLHQEGFTWKQARRAYLEVLDDQRDQPEADASDEASWELHYEECLQWLLVNLNEDQLPAGFDPRGRTLDVIAAPSKNEAIKATGQDSSNVELANWAKLYGLSLQEASAVKLKARQRQQQLGQGEETMEEVLWRTLVQAAGVSWAQAGTDDKAIDVHEQRLVANEEQEALQAIFGEQDYSVSGPTADGLVTMKMPIPFDDTNLFMIVQVRDGAYPACRPDRVWIVGPWPDHKTSAVLHTSVIKFIQDCNLGEPLIFLLYSKVQELLQNASDLAPVSLLPFLENLANTPVRVQDEGTTIKPRKERPSKLFIPRNMHPKERSPFWSVPPQESPPAIAFPSISRALENTRKSLPAAAARGEFLASLARAESQGGRVLLVTGDTGCGKTTQIPQFILEENPTQAKIIVAQPRRLAATGVASRVASERGEDRPGVGSVGYVVRGDSALSARSRLVFCTTGVLLRQLQNDGALSCLTHVVIDEVHERHLDTDILLGLLKQLLPSNKHLRVVLMSATLDADRFAAYWGTATPRMHIPGRTFPVQDFFLEDVLEVTGYVPPTKKKGGRKALDSGWEQKRKLSPWTDSEKSGDEIADQNHDESPASAETNTVNHTGLHLTIDDLVERVDEQSVDYDMLASLVKHLILHISLENDGSILIFLSGAPEINSAIEAIRKATRGMQLWILPLHGGLEPKQQNLVFKPAEKGMTKVVVSTNVAETSVTIPDCTVVIDSAREKQSSYDPNNRMPLLIEQFASRASLKQRRGRAGRVREGKCYKLISRRTFETIREHSEAEIQRSALDQTLLSLLFLGVERGDGSFLNTLLDPPNKQSIEAAASSLRMLGAVETGPETGELRLSPLGLHLAGIPAPPSVGKLLVMGSILGCRHAALVMAAAMSASRSPILRIDQRLPFKNQAEDVDSSIEEMKRRRKLEERSKLFKIVGNSDHAFMYAVYQLWKENQRQTVDDFGLSTPGMLEIDQLVRQLDGSLYSAGFFPSPDSDCNAKSWRIVRSVVVCALAPCQLVKVIRPAATYYETAEGAKEKDGEARGLKFFIRGGSPEANHNTLKLAEERVFIHPSSLNFSTGSYSCPWLVYHSLIRTTKAYIRDATESNSYALLLFGGRMQVQASKGLIVIDDWVVLSANARIGSLIGGLRKSIDNLLTRKVSEPQFELSSTEEMKLVFKLILTDGLG